MSAYKDAMQNNRAPYLYHPPTGPIAVITADSDILVVSKPAGLLSVPGRGPAHGDCLESRIRALYPDARIVHRLDMSTSGIMVMARNADAHRNLSRQFEQRQTDKSYIARVMGHMAEDEGEVDLPLICDWPKRPKQKVDFDSGKPALTKWQVIRREDHNITRVLLIPITGRTHQLRLHMQSLGHPILGDDLYAPPEALALATNLQLHAEKLDFDHPVSGDRCRFTDPCPF